jgi:hypothetical protein
MGNGNRDWTIWSSEWAIDDFLKLLLDVFKQAKQALQLFWHTIIHYSVFFAQVQSRHYRKIINEKTRLATPIAHIPSLLKLAALSTLGTEVSFTPPEESPVGPDPPVTTGPESESASSVEVGPAVVVVVVLVGTSSRSGVVVAEALTLSLMPSNIELAAAEFDAETVAVEDVRVDEDVSDSVLVWMSISMYHHTSIYQ